LPDIPTGVYERLARLLGLPDKAWACEIQSRWSRVHTPLSTVELARRLSQELPTAVSVSSFLGGKYTHTQRFIAFDVDCAKNPAAAGEAAVDIGDELMRTYGIPSGLTYTGKKGFRNWVWLDGELPDFGIATFQHKILTALGYTQDGSGHYRKGDVDCETLIRSGDGGIVKIPFSRHQDNDRSAYFEIPIMPDSISTIISHPPTDDDWLAAVWAFESWAVIEPMDVAICVDVDWDSGAPVSPADGRRKRPAPDPNFAIPTPGPGVYDMYERIVERPCLKKCLESVAHTYWPRAVLVLSLAAMGRTPPEIAEFFVKFVCDAEDLMNPGELQRQISYYYPAASSCMCRVFQNKHSPYYCCPGPCARNRPTDVEPPLKITIPPVTPLTTPQEAEAFFEGIIKSAENTSILGPARSGKTTGIGLAIIKRGESAIVLVPRISIIEDTWVKVFKLAKDRQWTTFTCCVPDIRDSCVKLKKMIATVRQENNVPDGELSAMERLPFFEKPNCDKCKYKYITPTTIEPNVIYGMADTVSGVCGYQTVIQQPELWNIIIMTNKKFNRIVSLTQDVGIDSPLYSMITSRGRYVMDEVSSYFETPDADIDVFSKYIPTGHEFKFLDALKDDVVKIRQYIETRIDNTPLRMGGRRAGLAKKLTQFNEMYDSVAKDIEDNFTKVIDDPLKNVFMFKRSVTIDEIDSIKKALILVQSAAEKRAIIDNEALMYLYDLMTLGVELEWIFTNDPSSGYDPRVTIKIAPKTIGYINAVTANRAQIIALDVQPPVVPVDRFFGVKFKHYNIGDRGHIYDNYVIIPDSRHVRASEVLRPQNSDRLLAFSDKVTKMFGEEVSDVLFPTIESENAIMGPLKMRYPKLTSRHHRGSLTMGVHCDRRVAVSVCAPFAPRKSLHWLKAGPYKDILADITHNQIWHHQQAKESMQGEARYIDPEGQVRSVVFAFGQPKWVVDRTYTNAVVKPKILNTLRGDDGKVALAQGWIWKCKGVIVESTEELRALAGILEGVCDRDVVNRSRLTMPDIERLKKLLDGLPPC
jgi:hypothetical protein